MKDYLHKDAKPGVFVIVREVIFDDRNDHYYCEFRVNMRSANKDATGTMVAIISNDFKSAERNQ